MSEEWDVVEGGVPITIRLSYEEYAFLVDFTAGLQVPAITPELIAASDVKHAIATRRKL